MLALHDSPLKIDFKTDGAVQQIVIDVDGVIVETQPETKANILYAKVLDKVFYEGLRITIEHREEKILFPYRVKSCIEF